MVRGGKGNKPPCYASSMIVEFDHRLEEHQRASRLYYEKKSWFARADKVVAVLLVLFGLVVTTLAGAHWWTLVWFFLAPLEWFGLLTLEPLKVRYVFKRSPKFHERTTLTFTESSVRYQTPSVDSTLAWSVFAELVEDEALFLLLYKTPRSYAVIPKRAFESEAAQQAFRELAKAKLARGL